MTAANDVTVDAQTLHEIYLAPFAAVIDAGVASIMCSYNVINGAYACGNRDMLTTILRGELKFDGFVTSDWGAMHGTDFINAGADLEMPGSGSDIASFYAGVPAVIDRPVRCRARRRPQSHSRGDLRGPTCRGQSLPVRSPSACIAALRQGSVTEATITQAAGRVLRQLQRFGYVTSRRTAPLPTGEQSAAVHLPSTRPSCGARPSDAAVLLKNEGGALPLIHGGPGRSRHDWARRAAGPSRSASPGEKSLGHIERQVSPVAALHAGAPVWMSPRPWPTT